MKIRRPIRQSFGGHKTCQMHKKGGKHKKQPFQYYLLSLFALCLLVAFYILSSNDNMPSISLPSRKFKVESGLQKKQTIIYKEVPERSSQSDGGVMRYAAFIENKGTKDSYIQDPLTIKEWATLMMTESEDMNDLAYSASQNLFSILKECQFEAFRFETKGCNIRNMEKKQFEFVLMKDSRLSSFAAAADDLAFEEHFQKDAKVKTGTDLSPAVVFPNLGSTALLIAPQGLVTDKSSVYGHLANFMRKAPSWQIQSTWQLVAQSFLNRVNNKTPDETVWLSTAGTGIAWLHFRLDDRPKYYGYRSFATET